VRLESKTEKAGTLKNAIEIICFFGFAVGIIFIAICVLFCRVVNFFELLLAKSLLELCAYDSQRAKEKIGDLAPVLRVSKMIV
jgi:hypothetical protein